MPTVSSKKAVVTWSIAGGGAPTTSQVPEIDLRRLLMCGVGLAPAGANVIMQLSRLSVGHGVAESVVETGALFRHPLKRTRTTLGYVTVALLGSDADRVALRREVNRQHRLVRSSAESRVPYNAFDPELQLWVAACMYRGLLDALNVVRATPPPSALDELHWLSSRFATTLQVPAAKWPVDRAAFELYWAKEIDRIEMDDVTRTYLYGVASLRFLPAPWRWAFGPLHRVITTGFLPEPFRRELHLPWSTSRALLFRVVVVTLAGLNRLLPRLLREFPLNLCYWDARRRLSRGLPFV